MIGAYVVFNNIQIRFLVLAFELHITVVLLYTIYTIIHDVLRKTWCVVCHLRSSDLHLGIQHKRRLESARGFVQSNIVRTYSTSVFSLL